MSEATERDDMRVLFLSNTPILGGTARILQCWLRLGRSHGMCGSAVVRAGSEFIDWARANQVSLCVDAMPWPDRNRPWESLWHAAKVAWWARRAGIDVIHCNEHDVYPFAALLRRLLKRPLVCHIRYRIEREFAEWAFRHCNAPDALLWTSYQQKADSEDAIAGIFPEERQHVLRLGVDLTSFGTLVHTRESTRQQWGIGTDEILIGTASPIRPRKRIEDFIGMIQYLADRHPQVVGIIAGGAIAGDEDYRDRIQQMIVASGLGRRLRWVGYLEPIEPFYHACDIAVSTSEYETFGNSVCEAMACCKPVVGYYGGAVAEVVGDAGFLVKTGDIDRLQAAVERFVRDAELRKTLGAKGQQRVAHEFNPAESLMRLLAIYRTLLMAKK
jgi:glycosyltransferase involved in cell wall biosynthesis